MFEALRKIFAPWRTEPSKPHTDLDGGELIGPVEIAAKYAKQTVDTIEIRFQPPHAIVRLRFGNGEWVEFKHPAYKRT
jgi:hypothetical protein